MKRNIFFCLGDCRRFIFFIIIGIFLLALSLVSASIGSTNYKINSFVVSDGGDNLSSTNFNLKSIVGIISGILSSSNYNNNVGFYYTLNTEPANMTVFLSSVDGTNTTATNLNCSSIVSDVDSDYLNVSVRWYKNGELSLSLDYNNNYPNATLFNAILDYGNTTKEDNWSCGLRIYDGSLYSGWSNSSDLTILNSLPTVNLDSPTNWNATTNRSPEFLWTGYDADGDSLIYTFNLSEHQFSGTAGCNDDILNSSISVENYTPTSDLLCLYDNGFYYNWSVRANDGDGDGSWSDTYHLNITAEILISLDSVDMIFGELSPFDINDTSDDSPAPFILNNDGNAVANVTINSSAIWDTQEDNSTYYQFKIDNVTGEEGAFSWMGSVVDWFNMPIGANVVAINQLNYISGDDSVEVDIRLEVPNNEGPGPKSASSVFAAGLAE